MNPMAAGSGGEKVEPLKGDGRAVTLLGSVVADTQATLSVRMPGKIIAVRVKEGNTVGRGQVLVLLDTAELDAQERTARAGVTATQAQVAKAQAGREAQKVKADADVKTAQQGLRQAETKYQQAVLARDAARDDAQSELTLAKEGVRKAEVGLDRARRTLRELEELSTVGGVSRSDLEGARSQVTVAQSDLNTAKAQVKRLQAGPSEMSSVSYRVALAQKDVDAAGAGVQQAREGVGTAEAARIQVLAVADKDIQAARAALEQARAGVTSTQAAKQQMQLASPISGVATAVTARAGETAQPGVPLVSIVSLSGLRVDALVPARQVSHLKEGQTAQITVETQPGKTFPARVSRIPALAEPDGRTFRVAFRFTAPVSLRPGQTAQITVLPR